MRGCGGGWATPCHPHLAFLTPPPPLRVHCLFRPKAGAVQSERQGCGWSRAGRCNSGESRERLLMSLLWVSQCSGHNGKVQRGFQTGTSNYSAGLIGVHCLYLWHSPESSQRIGNSLPPTMCSPLFAIIIVLAEETEHAMLEWLDKADVIPSSFHVTAR